jgi:murein DD-endopeptidase MepM/ murein hydrolase activator NlpD
LSNLDIESIKVRAAELDNRMKGIEQLYDTHLKTIRFTPSIWPLKGEIGSRFGVRTDPFSGEGAEEHLGIDISGPYGADVHSSADGIVILSGRMSDYGNLVIVDHGNGVTTRYAHLSRFAAHTGQHVNKGDLLGYVGLSGRTTGPHLHYEVRINDRPVDPLAYLPKNNRKAPGTASTSAKRHGHS